MSGPMTDSQYKARLAETGPLEIRLVTKTGKCPHAVGDTFYYETPYARPKEVCSALLHVVDFYTWRAALGFPSWESDDREVFRVHCPSKNGTVWELRKISQASDARSIGSADQQRDQD